MTTPPRLSQDQIRSSERALRKLDPRLTPWMRRIATPALERRHTAFASLCRAVIAQQLSNKAAETICGRFFEGSAHRGPTPAAVIARPEPELRALGLSRQKVSYVRSLAEAFGPGGALHRCRFAARTDADIIESLTQIKGVGRWTAEMFLIFWLHRPDVFASGDLALRHGLARLDGAGKLTPRECDSRAERWAPHRTVASLYLWRIAHYEA